MKYFIDTELKTDFENAVLQVKKNLPNFGFGVVTEFDLDEKFKEKLGVDFNRYKIIGACNPKYAYEAIKTELMVGTMLPCNIVVHELEPNKVKIAAIDPVASMLAIENEELKKAAVNIKDMLHNLIESIQTPE